MLMWILLSSAFLAVFMLIRAIFSKKIKAKVMYALWILVAVRLLIPTYIPVEVDLFVNHETPTITNRLEMLEKNVTANNGSISSDNEIAQEIVGTQHQTNVTIPEITSNTAQESAIDASKSSFASQILKHPILFIWMLGIICFGFYFISTNTRFHLRLKRSRIPLNDYDYKIPVYYVKWLKSPCMAGMIHPAIYVNDQIDSCKNAKYVIEHEYMHYCHKDMIWMLIQTVCLCIHWFNPLVWIASWLFRKDCEYACDEALANTLDFDKRIVYGRTLLEFSTNRKTIKTIFSTATSMSMNGPSMKKRVQKIINVTPKRILSCIFIVILIIGLFGCSMVSNTGKTGVEDLISDKYWNRTYLTDDSFCYYSFFPDGREEQIRFGTYSFAEKNGEKLLILDYDTLDQNKGVPTSFVVKRGNDGTVLMTEDDYYFMDKSTLSEDDEYPAERNNEYRLIEGTNGLIDDEGYFKGEYHLTNIASNHKEADFVGGYRFNLDGTFEDFYSCTYEVLNNHEIKIGDFTYQFLLENEGERLSLRPQEGTDTLQLTYVGPTKELSVYILNAAIYKNDTSGVKYDYTVLNNGTEEQKIDILIPVYLEYQFFVENTGFRAIENLNFQMIANEKLESLLASHKKFTTEEETAYYSEHDSILEEMLINKTSIETLKPKGAGTYSSLFKIGFTEESLEPDNQNYHNIFSEEQREDIAKNLRDITVIFNDGECEIARIDFNGNGVETGRNSKTDPPHLSIEISSLTKDFLSEKDILNAMSVVEAEFQNEGYERCILQEISYNEQRTYTYYSSGKEILVLDVNFSTKPFAGSAGLNSNSKYTYEFMLELKNGEWEIVSSGQG